MQLHSVQIELHSDAFVQFGQSMQSICGACNAFRGSSHQLEPPPSLPLSLPCSLPQSVGDPSLPLPPLPTQGSHPNGASLASILRISHFRIHCVAIDEKMFQTLWRCNLN